MRDKGRVSGSWGLERPLEVTWLGNGLGPGVEGHSDATLPLLSQGSPGVLWREFTLVLSLQLEYSIPFLTRELLVHSIKQLQAQVLLIK